MGLVVVIFGVILLYKFDFTSGFWLSPAYWTTIYQSGDVEPGRSSDNFISFPESSQIYIGYWISTEKNHHHEAYGNVYAIKANERGEKFCGLFVDVYQNKSVQLCGNFRILSTKPNALAGKNPFEFVPLSVTINDPDKAVEYLDWQIARHRTNLSEKWTIGCANILQRIAYFPIQNGQLKKIDFKEAKPNVLDDKMQVLHRSNAFDLNDLINNGAMIAPPPTVELPFTSAKLRQTTTSSSIKMPTTPSAPTIRTMMPNTTMALLRTTKTSTSTTQIPEYEHDYDNLSGAGIEWDAIVDTFSATNAAKHLEGGAILSIDDNELIVPKQK